MVGWGLYRADKIWGRRWTDETYEQVPREEEKEQHCCEKVPEGQVGERLGEDETTSIGKNNDDDQEGDDLEDDGFCIKSLDSIHQCSLHLN